MWLEPFFHEHDEELYELVGVGGAQRAAIDDAMQIRACVMRGELLLTW